MLAEGRDAVFNDSETNLPDKVASVTELADHHKQTRTSGHGFFPDGRTFLEGIQILGPAPTQR